MLTNVENNLKNELNNANLILRNERAEIWRLETLCNLKMKSIEEFENSTDKTAKENECLKQKLHDVNSRIEEVTNNIISSDRVINCLHETLADLEVRNKKQEFSIRQSQNNFELQLFVRKEQWKNREECLNNIPEVKSMKMAESELKSIQLEYDKLLTIKENIAEKISKANNKNCKKRNDIIIKFAESYVEMFSLVKREEQSKTLLRKLEAEFNDKLNIKSSLLLLQQKKPDKVLFWTLPVSTLDLIKKHPHESFPEDKHLEIIKDNLKPNFNHSKHKNILSLPKLDNKHLKSNEPSKHVTFRLPPSNELHEHTMQNTNNDMYNFKNENTNVLSNVQNSENFSNPSLMKNNSFVNDDNYMSSKDITSEPKKINCDNNKTQINKEDNFQTNKRKTAEDQSDFELKKPRNLVFDENNSIRNINLIESNLNQNLEKVEKLVTNTSMINNRVDVHEGSNNHNSPKNNSSELTKQNIMKTTSNNIFKMFGDVSQHQSSFLHDQINVLSGLFGNVNGDEQSESSVGDSFCNFDLADFDEENISESPNLQLSFMNSVNSNPNSMNDDSFQEARVKNAKESGNMQQLHLESLKTNNSGTSTMAGEVSRLSDGFTLPVRPHFTSSGQYRFNFN